MVIICVLDLNIFSWTLILFYFFLPMADIPDKPLCKHGVAFSTEEDCQLCCSWLHILQDVTTGTDQTCQDFWYNIHADLQL